MKIKFLIGLLSGVAFSLAIAILFLSRPALAVDPAVLAEKYKVSFPIAQLGGCTDYAACRTFCEDPINATACINFAKEKGFYQEEPVAKFVAVLSTAKSVLGCDSLESCQNYCEVPANYDKCNSFAKSAGLVGGYGEDPGKKETLSRAEDRLGCNSAEGCKGFCEKEENRTKCESFAKEVGLVGGTRFVGPGGCTSQDSCRAFCSDPGNFSVCKGFAAVTGVGEFKGPGGCTSEESCKSYCSSRPADCPGFGVEGRANYSSVEICNRTPNCSWQGNSCACGNFDKSESPAASCARYGCSWQDNSCRCTSGNVTVGATAQAPPGGTAGCTPPSDLNFCGAGKHYSYSSCRCEDNSSGGGCSASWGCPSGMSWNNSTCDCRTPSGDWRPPNSNTYPANGSTCPAPPGGCGTNRYWNYGTCSCQDSGAYSPTSGGPTMSRESQEATCRSGGGTCDWTSGFCYCRGYQTPSGTTNTNSTNYGSCPSGQYWNGSSCVTSSAPTMSRESQQSACSNCGGTCTWNGDTCACQCKTSGSSGSTTTQTSGSQSPEDACKATSGCSWNGSSCQCSSSTSNSPSPSPSPSTDPAAACSQTSGCSWNGSSCQCGSTQGASTEESLGQLILDFFAGLFGR